MLGCVLNATSSDAPPERQIVSRKPMNADQAYLQPELHLKFLFKIVFLHSGFGSTLPTLSQKYIVRVSSLWVSSLPRASPRSLGQRLDPHKVTALSPITPDFNVLDWWEFADKFLGLTALIKLATNCLTVPVFGPYPIRGFFVLP